MVSGHSIPSGAQVDAATLDKYLSTTIKLDAGQLADAQRGRAVSKILPTDIARDITVFGMVGVHATRASFAEHLADAEKLVALRSKHYGMVGDPVAPSDLRSITVRESEYADLRTCKVNDCHFKLPASTMQQFAQDVEWGSASAHAQVDSLVRADLEKFIGDYRARGNAAMVRYDDTRSTQSSDAFASLLAQSQYMREYALALRDYLIDYPSRKPEGARDNLYWSDDDIPRLRSTFTVTHMVTYVPRSGPPMVARKQIYADHYFEGAFELLTAPDAPVPGMLYLISVRRYRFDDLPSGGLLNIRGRVRDQLGALVRTELDAEKRAIEAPR